MGSPNFTQICRILRSFDLRYSRGLINFTENFAGNLQFCANFCTLELHTKNASPLWLLSHSGNLARFATDACLRRPCPGRAEGAERPEPSPDKRAEACFCSKTRVCLIIRRPCIGQFETLLWKMGKFEMEWGGPQSFFSSVPNRKSIENNGIWRNPRFP